ncbi:MAG: dihydrodipicolinate synthase family protein [Kiloniellales bacterium]|nr:dihydrodipicolinate synthase family protein [Kiloniellales bacterium]
MRFRGIYTPVITPFRADGAIDHDGWARMIDHLIGAGVHGLVIGGTTGEVYALSRDERVAQFAKAKELIAGRVPWLAGVNDFRTEDCCAYAAAARAQGADALLVASPPYSQPSEQELVSHCLRIDRAAGLPIMLYNYPGRTGAHMGEAFLRGVTRSANVQAIKESSGDVDRIHLIATAFPQLQLSCGADDQALEFFAWGAESWVCAATNCLAAETLALYEACVVEKDFDAGRALMTALLPVMTVLERGGKFAQCVKYGCELQGLPGGAVRAPLRPMGKALKDRMREALGAAQAEVRRIRKRRTGARAAAATSRSAAQTAPVRRVAKG